VQLRREITAAERTTGAQQLRCESQAEEFAAHGTTVRRERPAISLVRTELWRLLQPGILLSLTSRTRAAEGIGVIVVARNYQILGYSH
jgi:hypothetical protein